MVALITAIHIIVCAFLIIVVLLQSGQSGDIAAAFGGMGSQTAFGTRTAATVLTKATTYAAIIFMFTSITLVGICGATLASLRIGAGRHAIGSDEVSASGCTEAAGSRAAADDAQR